VLLNIKCIKKKDKSDEYTPSSVTLDKDDINHMTWLFNRATERATQFGITGVTYHLTMQVVKNIIPAIASTNALIAASCVNEALKFRSRAALLLDNFFLFLGQQPTGTNTNTLRLKRNPDCRHCKPPVFIKIDKNESVKNLINQIQEKVSLDEPSIVSETKILYETKFSDLISHAPWLPPSLLPFRSVARLQLLLLAHHTFCGCPQ